MARKTVAEVGLWLDGEESVAWRLFFTAAGRLLQRLDAELTTSCGLSLAEYEILVLLNEAGDAGMRMTAVADAVLVSPSGLTRRVDRLTADGLVERRSCPTDRRGVLAVLTPAGGARLVEAAPRHVAGVRRWFVEPLDRRQLGVLSDALASVAAAVHAG
ncbi:MAG: MarR family winged helix-turn-helix transcriptional regulator [Acidimicrobiales bacterium]